MRLRVILAATVSLTAPVLAPSCGGEEEPSGGLTVVATTTQVADLVRNVGGRRVEVAQLLDPGSDPHGYEPRPSDARALSQAGLAFRSGGEIDEWLDDVISGAGGDVEVVTLYDAARARGDDPHWWHDPLATLRAVEAIREALARIDERGAASYERRARAYSARLRGLHRDIARCMGAIPPRRRKLVTTHDALGHFARRYEIEVIGALIPSRSTHAQPSAGATQRLVERIRAEGVDAIFPESSLDPRLERAVAREAGVRVEEALWVDALGPSGSSGESYLASLASNAETIARGFGARCAL